MVNYSSNYTSRKVTPAQKIAEIVCENRASDMEIALPEKFWNNPDWKGYFMFQLKEASKLLKTFSDKHIIKALRQTNATSLRLGSFIAKCKQFRLEEKNAPSIDMVAGPKNSVGAFSKKNNLPEDL